MNTSSWFMTFLNEPLDLFILVIFQVYLFIYIVLIYFNDFFSFLCAL